MNFKNSVIVILLISFLISKSFSQVMRDRNNPYHLTAPVRTVIKGNIRSDLKDSKWWVKDSLKLAIKDFSNFYIMDGKYLAPVISVKIINDSFYLEIFIDHPVYIFPAYPGSGAIPPYNVFKGMISNRPSSMGMPVEPGDSLVISDLHAGFFGGIFFDEQSFSGKGVEKFGAFKKYLETVDYTIHLSVTRQI